VTRGEQPSVPRRTDFVALIPELAAWNEGQRIDVLTWLCLVGSHAHAVAYGRLFWPEFTVREGCVLLADFEEGPFLETLRTSDRRTTEWLMNHRHILDLFSEESGSPTRELVLHLGRLLKEMWTCKLARDFPERRFTVDFREDGVEKLEDYQVTFFQEQEPSGFATRAARRAWWRFW
jgi:hypothetical protein